MKMICPRCALTVYEQPLRYSLREVFEQIKELREESPSYRLDIDELAEEIWPEINQKERG